MAVALVVGLLVQRSVLLRQVHQNVDADLRQEVDEFQVLSTGRDPDTGEPFGDDIEGIFDTFLRRNIASRSEGIYTLVRGEPYAASPTGVQLLADSALVERWAALRDPTQEDISTEAGTVRYLAVPVVSDGEIVGTFVAAIFLDERVSVVGDVIRTGAMTYGGAFLLTSVVAWFVAGRVLQPLNELTEAARTVSESNWRERIHVEGDDQIALLARTFNEMLDRLESAFDAQRRLIDDAGHELRTPITVVRGHLELMSQTESPAQREETLRLVMDELDRMSRMVEDLLLLARAEQSNFLHLQPVDIDDLVEDIALKSRMLGDRGWRVVERAPVVAIVDQQRLTQAMMNLSRNAVEHTPDGTVVSLGSRVEGDAVLLWVEDNGPGIALDAQRRIFERFARGESRHMEGAGLGLAIAKVIAEAHGGAIRLSSCPGEGARFTLELPLDTAEDDGMFEDSWSEDRQVAEDAPMTGAY